MWEMALEVCKELERQYEEEVMDFAQLSDLLKRRARFYDCIMKQVRPEPEYFRVAYYGRGFPAFLQNKVECCFKIPSLCEEVHCSFLTAICSAF